jgi:Transport and Golgi organisation 2
MCTVSVMRLPGLLRLVSNRDERRTRPTALPPARTHAGSLRVLAPIDPSSQGTWVACSEIGLAIALLNVNPPDADARIPPRSRGGIVPGLMRARSLDEVAALAAAVDHTEYSPFRLVAVHAGEGDVLEIAPAAGSVRRLPLAIPQMFTSSGLGDHQVEGPRRHLFEQTVVRGGERDLRDRQDRFHAHRWRDRLAVSVHMSRPDAWTVSRTTIEIGGSDIAMFYAAEPDWTLVTARLSRLAPDQRADSST